MDPERRLQAHTDELQDTWRLAGAEVRLIDRFLQGLDLSEASASLGITHDRDFASITEIPILQSIS